MEHKIAGIEKDSIAQELGIAEGDTLITLNDQAIRDVLDYKEHMAEDRLLVLIKKGNRLYEYDVEKYPGEDLGLTFASATMDPVKRCSNQCVFCFIDQLPTGLRPTLYFKDDDYRLSLLHGNYVSLSNLVSRGYGPHNQRKNIPSVHINPYNKSRFAAKCWGIKKPPPSWKYSGPLKKGISAFTVKSCCAPA
jgi:NifB/MoaA-like Fe-S oxidoreductase